MGVLYSTWTDALGVHHADERLAVFENGEVYLVADGFLGTIAAGEKIAEYENGNIYSVTRFSRDSLIGGYENGKIYGVDSTLTGYSRSLPVGSCSGGDVYSSKEGKIATYSGGDDEGAAAAAAVLLFQLKSSASAYSDATKEGLGFDHKNASDKNADFSIPKPPKKSPISFNTGCFLGVLLLMIPGVILSMVFVDLPLMFMMNPVNGITTIVVIAVIAFLVYRRWKKKRNEKQDKK